MAVRTAPEGTTQVALLDMDYQLGDYGTSLGFHDMLAAREARRLSSGSKITFTARFVSGRVCRTPQGGPSG